MQGDAHVAIEALKRSKEIITECGGYGVRSAGRQVWVVADKKTSLPTAKTEFADLLERLLSSSSSRLSPLEMQFLWPSFPLRTN